MELIDYIQTKTSTKYYIGKDNPLHAFTGYEENIMEMINPNLDYSKRFNRSNFKVKDEWKPVDKFYFSMEFQVNNLSRSRSNIIIEDYDTGFEYKLAPKGIVEIFYQIQKGNIEVIKLTPSKTIFKGIFTIVKQGMNYYLMPYYTN